MATLTELVDKARANETDQGCHPWPGNVNDQGYGRRSVGHGRQVRAHVLVWEQANGPVPAGHELDHLCHTRDTACLGGSTCSHRRCIRLDHLEAVTKLENWSRGRSRNRIGQHDTHCGHGHEMTAENTYKHQHRGRTIRRCRTCVLGQNRRSTHRNVNAHHRSAPPQQSTATRSPSM